MVEARTVLWYMVLVGFAINFLVCINLNIAIVEMIQPSSHRGENGLLQNQHFTTRDSNVSLAVKGNDYNISVRLDELRYSNTSILNSNHDSMESATNETSFKAKKFHWNEHEQAMALGAFFWTHWITQIPGGVLAKKYGTKLVFGLSNVISCWLCFIIPMAAKLDLKALVVLRLLQGLLTGLSWPSMHDMTAKWISPNARSKFVTAYYGSSVGIAVFYPLFAYVMHFSSWEWVFHISGVFGTIWWFGWLYFVYDTPAQHPRISTKELTTIEKPLKNIAHNSNHVTKTPWKAIFTSKSVWMNVIGQFGGVWGLFTLMTQTPTYFKMIHNWDIKSTGIFSGMPHLIRVAYAYIFSLGADYLLRTDKMSRTNVRKLATVSYCAASGLCVLALAYLGTNRILAISFITLATMFQGSGSSGPLSSMIDIAPNYAGIIFGLCGTIGCMPGFISTYIVGALTLNNETFEAWTNIYLISASISIGSGVIYICFADSTLKPWNGHSLAKDKDKGEQLLVKDIAGCKEGNLNVKE